MPSKFFSSGNGGWSQITGVDDWRVVDSPSQGVPSINTGRRTDGRTDIPHRSATAADFTRPYNLWYGFGAPMCPGSDSRSSVDPASRRRRPINQPATTARAIVQARTRWYLTGADAHRAAAGRLKIRFDSVRAVELGGPGTRSRAYSSS